MAANGIDKSMPTISPSKAAHALATGAAHEQRHNRDRRIARYSNLCMSFGPMNVYTNCCTHTVSASASMAVMGLDEQCRPRPQPRRQSREPTTGIRFRYARDQAERGGIRHAQHRKPYAARRANDEALQHRGTDIAAQNARKRDAQHVGLFFMVIGHPIDRPRRRSRAIP